MPMEANNRTSCTAQVEHSRKLYEESSLEH